MARSSIFDAVLIACYLAAAVGANLIVAWFGPAALPITAICLIPFDMTSRDVLHNRWNGKDLKARMAALIASGSLLTLLVNLSAWRIAAASCAAFAVAGTVDAAVYHLLGGRSTLFKMNASNLASAITDSLIFPLVAFGGTSLLLSGSQAAAKFAGGVAWSLIFVAAASSRRSATGQVPAS